MRFARDPTALQADSGNTITRRGGGCFGRSGCAPAALPPQTAESGEPAVLAISLFGSRRIGHVGHR